MKSSELSYSGVFKIASGLPNIQPSVVIRHDVCYTYPRTTSRRILFQLSYTRPPSHMPNYEQYPPRGHRLELE
jgi:hypothetical protein